MNLQRHCAYVIFKTLLCASFLSAQAQHAHAPPVTPHPEEVEAFVEQVRQATDRFRDHQTAVREGFTLIGPDMPSMGEHWVHLQLAMRRELDIMWPAVLTYLPIGEERLLTGAAYVFVTYPGEEPPEFFHGGVWHFHAGSIDEEAHGLSHADHNDAERTRLAMIHAWVWQPNPDGTFAGDNWTLPYVRIGIPTPDRAEPDAGRALSLVSGGVDFFGRAIELALPGHLELQGAARSILNQAADRVQELVDQAWPQAPPDETLTELWRCTWENIREVLPTGAWAAVAVLAPSEHPQTQCDG